jgi:alpha-tubulin suppressor-like RCC1 family protein
MSVADDSGSARTDQADAAREAPLDGSADEDAGTVQQLTVCSNTECGAHAHCDNDSGAPVCSCDPGYEGDGQSCKNVDECAQGTDDCDANARCVDEPGTWSCECKPGYEGDGKSCTPNPCEPRVDPCDAATTTCRADGKNAVCDCAEGRGRCDGNKLACTSDLESDADHCGSCDFACAGDLQCQKSTCEQPIKALALGYNHSCAIDRNDRIVCWGTNNAGQLQRNTASSTDYKPALSSLGPTKLLSAGTDFSCARLASDDLVCWGSNGVGQIVPTNSTPAPAASGLFMLGSHYDTVQQIASGQASSCMLIDGAAYCWGHAFAKELGSDMADLKLEDANRVSLGVPALQLSVGYGQACAVGTDQHLRCWGAGNATPREVGDAAGTPLTGVTSVASGINVASGCAVITDGRVACWGVVPAAASSLNAVTVVDASGVPLVGAVQVGVGVVHACARRDDGTVVCWGRRDLLGTGASATTIQSFYVELGAIHDVIDIAVNGLHTCVRRRNGQVQCWGDNSAGQVGVNPAQTTTALEPVNVIGLP